MRLRRAAIFLWALCLSAGGAIAAETAASIVFAVGTVVVVGADGLSRPAARGGELKSGEVIDTSPDGKVQLRFRDGASMSLQPNSRFRVDDYRFSGTDAAANDDKGFFSLLKGGFRTISGLIGKNRREQYRVGTAVATIGIRGTEYNAALSTEGLNVTTVAGLVEVCNRAGCVLVQPGDTAVTEGADRKPYRKPPVAASGVSGGGDVLPKLSGSNVEPDTANLPQQGQSAPQAPPKQPTTAPLTAPSSYK